MSQTQIIPGKGAARPVIDPEKRRVFRHLQEEVDRQVLGTTHPVSIGHRLAAAIAYRGFTAAALADLSGVNRQTIWRYQTGKVAQSFPVVARLAEVLRVRLDYLAYGTGKIDRGGKAP